MNIGDWFFEHLGWFIVGLTGLLIWAIVFCQMEENKNNAINSKVLISQGYDISNVSVFLKNSGYSYADLVSSSALQAEYSKFINGQSSDFMKEARIRKSLKDTKDSADSARMMSSVSMGMSAASMGSR